MADINIYLVDLEDAIGSDARRVGISHILKNYFDKCVAYAKLKNTSVYVSFVNANPQASDKDLIGYFQKATPHIVEIINPKLSPPTGLYGDGYTTWNPTKGHGSDMVVGASSEVKYMAHLTFHEFMHQKLHMNDDQLHKRGGIAADPSNDLTEKNVSDMAGKLKTGRKQWIEGFSILKARSSGDILSY